MGSVSVRDYHDSDRGAVLELLEAALGSGPGRQRTPEWFDWKHTTNPFGRSIMFVASADDRLVGLRAFMRWNLLTRDGNVVRCVRAVDTATHPEYQRRGIFRMLTETALEAARDAGIDMVFNTPNPRSGAGYLKMGWQVVGPIGVMVSPRLGGLFRKRVAGENTHQPPLVGDALPATSFAIDDRPPRGLRTPRTEAYLEWRFAGNPNATYHKVVADGGVAVLRSNVRNGRPELVISDVFGSEASRAIRAARQRSRASYMVGWFSKGSPERSAAVHAGVFPIPRVKALSLIARPLVDMPVDVRSLQTWDLSMGDLELL